MDAQYGEAADHGGTGCVVRGTNGNLIRAQSRWYEFAASARMMEAYAIRDAVRLASGSGSKPSLILCKLSTRGRPKHLKGLILHVLCRRSRSYAGTLLVLVYLLLVGKPIWRPISVLIKLVRFVGDVFGSTLFQIFSVIVLPANVLRLSNQ